jgi:hypothetical protein
MEMKDNATSRVTPALHHDQLMSIIRPRRHVGSHIFESTILGRR